MFGLAYMGMSFFVYSILGWLLMTTLRSAEAGRYVSAGFLSGPACPFFGLGALVLLWLAPALRGWPPLVFIAGAAISLLLDALFALVMRKLFRVRRRERSGGNLRAILLRLTRAALSGLLAALLVFVVHPRMAPWMAGLPVALRRAALALLCAGLFIDLLYSLYVMDRLVRRARGLRDAEQSAGEASLTPAGAPGREDAADGMPLPEVWRGPEAQPPLVYAHALADEWRPEQRVALALPGLLPAGLEGEIAALQNAWDRAGGKKGRPLKEKLQAARSAVAPDPIPFARGNGFYKMVWVFTVACVLGVLLETAFCLISRGVLESRQGMIYGPFNQVYGLGAVVMALALQPLAKKNDGWLFLGGMLLGGAYEFACSWVQERVFGTVSWDYSHNPASLGGRTSLQLMLAWGIIGVVFMRGIYPRLSETIERIPRRIGVPLTWALAIFMALNLAVSAVAVGRWIARVGGVPAQNGLAARLDRRYPDKVMEKIYPSMQFPASAGGLLSQE